MIKEVINLGFANGWSTDDRNRFELLKQRMVKQSFSARNLGRCYNEYSFDIVDEDILNLLDGQPTISRVIYKVDSGD